MADSAVLYGFITQNNSGKYGINRTEAIMSCILIGSIDIQKCVRVCSGASRNDTCWGCLFLSVFVPSFIARICIIIIIENALGPMQYIFRTEHMVPIGINVHEDTCYTRLDARKAVFGEAHTSLRIRAV